MCSRVDRLTCVLCLSRLHSGSWVGCSYLRRSRPAWLPHSIRCDLLRVASANSVTRRGSNDVGAVCNRTNCGTSGPFGNRVVANRTYDLAGSNSQPSSDRPLSYDRRFGRCEKPSPPMVLGIQKSDFIRKSDFRKHSSRRAHGATTRYPTAACRFEKSRRPAPPAAVPDRLPQT